MEEINFVIINEWEGGKPGGSCDYRNNTYIVRFKDKTMKTFNPIKYDNAETLAKEYHVQQSLEKGFTKNQYRLVECDIEGSYYEVKLKDGITAKVDKEDLHLVISKKWGAYKTGNGKYVMRTGTDMFFHRYIYPEIKYICHTNGDSLDNRRKNLSEKTSFGFERHVTQSKVNAKWTGGIPTGSLCFLNNAYVVRFTDGTRKTFSLHTCESLEDAKIQACKYRTQTSLNKGLTKNQYRLVKSDTDGIYYEIKLQDKHIAKVDVDDFKCVQQRVWYAKKGTGSSRYYMYASDKNTKVMFHRVLFPEYTQVDHINRDGLDNRRKNLRSVSVAENNINQKKRTDNKSGKTGIHYSNYDKCWIVQWPEDGKRKKKSFSESKYGYDGAKLMAINHRQKMDNKLGLLNGYDSNEDISMVVKPISIDKVQIKEKLLSTNKSGKKGVYYVDKYNFWAVERRDADGKKKCKRFYVGTKRNYDEAQKLAMEFQT